MMEHEASFLSDSSPQFKYGKDGQRLVRIVMNMPTETQTAIEAAALYAGRTWSEQLAYIVDVCSEHHDPDREDPRTREDWLRLFETIEVLEDLFDWAGGGRWRVAYLEEELEHPHVTVSIPAEIGMQMVEAQPSRYGPALVERIQRARLQMKQDGVIPQLEEEPVCMTLPVVLGSELDGAVSADAMAAGRTLAEQIAYEIEVNHGWRFPDPGDTRFEERIRTLYTLREWVNLYLRFHVRFIGSARERAFMFRNHFGPLLSVSPSKLSRTSVMQWARAIGQQHPSAARNVVERLCNMYSKATEWGLYEGENPAAKCRLFPQRSRARFLQTEEITRVLQALKTWPLKIRIYFSVLLLSGARMSELRLMQWRHVDLTEGTWHKPTTKNGQPQTVPLSRQTCALLDSLPRDTRFVFHGELTNNHVNRDGPWSRRVVFYHWQKIRKAAKVDDVTIHDLRRTCASWLAMHGENIAVIQKVLNHSQLATTATYARMNMAPVRTALEGHAERMLLLGPQAVTPPPSPVLADPPAIKPDDALRGEMEWPG